MIDWEDIVARHGPAVWRTVWRLLSNDADALDCYQQVFLDVVELSRRETILDWSAILRRIAINRAIDQLRARYRETSRFDSQTDASGVAGVTQDPSTRLVQAETAEKLRAAIAALPPRQAEAFCLTAFDQWTYREVAQRLKIEPSAVGMLINRARKSLRESFAAVAPPSHGSRSNES